VPKLENFNGAGVPARQRVCNVVRRWDEKSLEKLSLGELLAFSNLDHRLVGSKVRLI